jgi:hypothetical protein
MRIQFTTRAHIALEQLSPAEHNRACRFFERLEHSEALLDLKSSVHKLRTQAGKVLFIARLSPRYRAILTADRGEVTVLEIMDHDRLSRTYGITGDAL